MVSYPLACVELHVLTLCALYMVTAHAHICAVDDLQQLTTCGQFDLLCQCLDYSHGCQSFTVTGYGAVNVTHWVHGVKHFLTHWGKSLDDTQKSRRPVLPLSQSSQGVASLPGCALGRGIAAQPSPGVHARQSRRSANSAQPPRRCKHGQIGR